MNSITLYNSYDSRQIINQVITDNNQNYTGEKVYYVYLLVKWGGSSPAFSIKKKYTKY